MTITVNYLILAAILLVLGFIVFKITRTPKNETKNDFIIEQDLSPTIEYMVDQFAIATSATLRSNPQEMDLDREEMERQTELIANLREDFEKSEYGDPEALSRVKEYCLSFITREFAVNSHEECDKVIRFSNPEYLTGNDKMEIMYFVYKKLLGQKTDLMSDPMQALITENGFNIGEVNEEDGLTYYVITKERMNEAYENVMIKHKSEIVKNYTLSLRDKQEIIVHRIISLYKGWNILNIFYESAIDEIMTGTSGIPAGTYRVPKMYANAPRTYDNVWIVFRGMKLDFECLSFGTYDEYMRVVDNIAKFEASAVLSKAEPGLQGTMEDGSRIVVARNPFGTAEGIWLRKFDTARAASLHWLYGTSKYDVIPICMFKWLVMACCNGLITGGMGTGKTTCLRTAPHYTEPMYSIRTYEKRFELNLAYTYPRGRNIFGFQETEMFSEQDGIDFGKKTMGDITYVGEIARSIQTAFWIQTCNVASRQGLGTHHANTMPALIEALSDDLLREGIYDNKNDAIRAVIKVLNFDIHLANTGTNGNRHIERISIAIPLQEKPFPSELEENKDNSVMKNTLLDASYYMKDQVKRQLYTTLDLVVWVADDELENTGHYELRALPTEELRRQMVNSLNEKRRKEFEYDMQMIQLANDVYNNNQKLSATEAEELKQWEERIIA